MPNSVLQSGSPEMRTRTHTRTHTHTRAHKHTHTHTQSSILIFYTATTEKTLFISLYYLPSVHSLLFLSHSSSPPCPPPPPSPCSLSLSVSLTIPLCRSPSLSVISSLKWTTER
ncbi:hypothetical protein INR49_005685 [Caranx melampygus]|nr:hypothetical protein INR49_005685 [Caranx melampygus]